MRKRILFVSDNPINGYGGGSVENRKYYDALKDYSSQKGYELKVISIDQDFCDALPVKVEKNKKIDMLVRLQGHSSFLYYVWKKNLSAIIDYKPDLVVLGRSRFGFIAKSIRKVLPDCKIITNVDNVEWDYVNAYFAEAIGLKARLMHMLEKVVVYRDERNCIRYSDKCIYLTQRNVDRCKEVYHFSEQNPTVVPICLEKEIPLALESSMKHIVFIGSLNYASNIVAVKMLINQVWYPHYRERNDIRLIIAGRNPAEELISLCESIGNILLVRNFDSLEELIPKGSMIVAPIEKGAGMKVKVAEALSMGLMIAASDEALVGYENAVKHDYLGGIIKANTCKDYQDAIQAYSEKGLDDLQQIADQNKAIYKNFYSYDVSNSAIHELCNELLR